jgi:hypothetical protein
MGYVHTITATCDLCGREEVSSAADCAPPPPARSPDGFVRCPQFEESPLLCSAECRSAYEAADRVAEVAARNARQSTLLVELERQRVRAAAAAMATCGPKDEVSALEAENRAWLATLPMRIPVRDGAS